MLARFMIVGLGGSGGKTIRYLKQAIDEWFHSIGWNEGIPRGWQFLHIDTPLAQDDPVLPGGVPLLSADEYMPIVEAQIPFGTVDEAIAGKDTSLLEGWRVDPAQMAVPITKGAGQYRAVGRTLGLWRAEQMKRTIEGKVAELTRAGTPAQLGRLYEKAYGQDPGEEVEPVPIVVTSLAGGTGSGIFLDVCDLLRSFKLGWTDQSIGILYAADVFHQLPPGDRAGVHANTAAALAELVSGYYTSEGDVRVPGIGDALLMERSGPRFPFIVGHANTKGVAFGDQLEVYRVMGRCLAAAMTDPQIQNDLTSYTVANWPQRARKYPDQAQDSSMLMMAPHFGVLEALGFSELELGTSRFERYAERRFTRDAIEWLLDGHQQRADRQRMDDRLQPDEIIGHFAEEYFVTFLNNLRLNERGPDNDQILESIDLTIEAKRSAMNSALGHLRTNVSDIVGNTAPKDDWIQTITDQAELWWRGWVQEYESTIRQHAAEWAEAIGPRILKEVGVVASLFGLPVAERIVSKTIDELNEVAEELQNEQHEFEVLAQHLHSDVYAAMEGARGKVAANFQGVEAGLQAAVRTAGVNRVQAKLRMLAARLSSELASGYLVPLYRTIRDDTERLRQQLEPGQPGSTPIDNWPRHAPDHDRAVPDDLVPGKSVHTVIPISGYPSLFDQLLGRSLPASVDTRGDRENTAREAVITGGFLDEIDDPEAQAWISVEQEWVPDPLLLVGGSAKQSARFDLHIGREDIRRRSVSWMHRPGTAFERYLQQGLRAYLSPTEPREELKRQDAFKDALQKAFTAAEPLIDLDQAMLNAVHGAQELGQRATPSFIPLRDHPLEEWVREFLIRHSDNRSASEIEDFLVKDERIVRVSVYSMLGGACHPMIMRSLANPIAEGWGSASDSRRIRDFWQWRRSRPLAEALPIPDTMARAIIRGWFTARVFGMLDIEMSDHGKIVLALRTDSQTTHRFNSFIAQPTGDPNRNPQRVLASFLESLTVAMAEAARTQRFGEFLGIYRALMELGTEQGAIGVGIDSYHEPHQSIVRWIHTGTPPPGSTGLSGDLASLSDRGARVAGMARLFRNTADQYETMAAHERSNGARSLGTGNAWLGIANDMTQEIRRLAEAIEDTATEAPML